MVALEAGGRSKVNRQGNIGRRESYLAPLSATNWVISKFQGIQARRRKWKSCLKVQEIIKRRMTWQIQGEQALLSGGHFELVVFVPSTPGSSL